MDIIERLRLRHTVQITDLYEAADEIGRLRARADFGVTIRGQHQEIERLQKLIHEKNAEIERLKAENAKLRHELQVGLTEIARLRAENGRLQALCKTYLDLDMDAAQREIERLKGEHEALRQALFNSRDLRKQAFETVHEQIVWVLQTSAPGLSEQMKQIIADTVIRRVANILAASRALEEKSDPTASPSQP